MPQKIRKVIIPFLTEKTTEDQFHDMILCCYEIAAGGRHNSFANEAKQQIMEMQKEERKRDNAINNPYRNFSLNQCFGDSKTPVSEWLIPPGQSEWDDFLDFEE